MMSDENGLKFWQRIMIVTFSATLGAAAVMWYLLDREREMGSAAPRRTSAGIRIKPTTAPKAATIAKPAPAASIPEALTLALSASPRTFKRGTEGAVRAKSLPGAQCTLSAKYSTGRTPTGLDDGALTCDEDGSCEWTWSVGTSGSHVDVEVVATKVGYEDVTQSKRISIKD